MKGSVNGHHFEIEGEGKEKPYEYVCLRRQTTMNYFITMHHNLC